MVNVTTRMLAKAFLKLKSIVTDIQGSLIPAKPDQNGLMSGFDKMIVDQRGRRAVGLDADRTYDILKDLDIGYYVGRLFTNAPQEADRTISLVEVTGWTDYLQYKFIRLADGKTWYRTIYSTQYDTGWNDTPWVAVVPINGFTGRCAVRKVVDNNHSSIELRFELNGSLKAGAPIDIAVIPQGYTSLDPSAIHFVGTGAIANGSVPVGLYIHQGNKLGAYRLENSADTISIIRGFIHVEKSDSTL